MQSTFVEHTLPNGLRVVCEVMPRVSSAAAGFFVKTGSRYERPPEHGVSHFLEHMCFKGNERRGWQDINIRFDELGSIYNAFTSKEHTVYYGWVPSERLLEQLELLADLVRPSVPPDEFETERKVILEEIAMSGDSYDHHVSNFLHQAAFAGHGLAHEILGEKETIERLPRDTMVRYHAEHYAPNNMFLVAAGNVEPEAFFARVGRCCQDWVRSANGDGRLVKPQPLPAGVRKKKLEQFKQHTLVLAFPSVPHDSPDAETIEAFVSLFGGSNSRCYWNIVQQGIASQAGAVWLSYRDCGIMALYAEGEPEQCQRMLDALRSQARDVAENGVRPEEVQRVRNQRRTQLALEGENPRTRLMQLVDDLEMYGAPRTTEARMAAVEAVSAASVADYLGRHPITGDGLLLSIGPGDWPA